MKKQIFSFFILLMLVISSSFLLSACGQNSPIDSIEIITPASTLVYKKTKVLI